MSPNKERALTALLTHKTRVEAAAAANIDPRTLRRYFEDAEFSERYREELDKLLQDADAQARQIISPALSVLVEIMGDGSESTPARISAAKAAIDYALRLREAVDTSIRLSELERAIIELEGGDKK